MILGLTGAFGSGKSSCLDFFRRRQWQVYDADGMCHQLYREPPEPLERSLHALFPAECFGPDGRMDRAAVGKIVFARPEMLEKLNRAVEPFLREMLEKRIGCLRAEKADAVFEIPLLFEGDWERYFDRVLTVWTVSPLRISRLAKRGFTPEDAALRDARQLPPETKLERADFAVINNGSCDYLFRQLERIFAPGNGVC